MKSKPINDSVDFSNTELAFTDKSNKELKRIYRLFQLMNKPWLTNVMSELGLLATKLHLPFHETIVRKTIFEVFCGGISLLDSQKAIDRLRGNNAFAVLDYGAEGKSDEEDLNLVMEENVKAIKFAASNNTVPVVSTKITGLAENELLIALQSGNELNATLKDSKAKLDKRLEQICSQAEELGVRVFIDAEETWMQDAIDYYVNDLMRTYNKKNVVVYNTFQLYRKDRLDYLHSSFEDAQAKGYNLGAKIVRGAYMEKERAKAIELGIESPIHETKKDTDTDYDQAVRFCVKHYQSMATCLASHNLKSNLLQAEMIEQNQIQRNHPNLNFCQLLGMSDYVTYNLSRSGYNAAKYLVYGPVKDVIPYLIRRAKENTSVTGEMSRELNLISKEMNRRKLV